MIRRHGTLAAAHESLLVGWVFAGAAALSVFLQPIVAGFQPPGFAELLAAPLAGFVALIVGGLTWKWARAARWRTSRLALIVASVLGVAVSVATMALATVIVIVPLSIRHVGILELLYAPIVGIYFGAGTYGVIAFPISACTGIIVHRMWPAAAGMDAQAPPPKEVE